MQMRRARVAARAPIVPLDGGLDRGVAVVEPSLHLRPGLVQTQPVFACNVRHTRAFREVRRPAADEQDRAVGVLDLHHAGSARGGVFLVFDPAPRGAGALKALAQFGQRLGRGLLIDDQRDRRLSEMKWEKPMRRSTACRRSRAVLAQRAIGRLWIEATRGGAKA